MRAKIPNYDLDHIIEKSSVSLGRLNHKSIFITGASGFIGSWLVEALAHANQTWRTNTQIGVLARSPAKFSAKYPYITDPISGNRVEVFRGEMSLFNIPINRSFDYVIHCANSSPASNKKGAEHIVKFARSHGTERLLFLSSGAAYGKRRVEGFFTERNKPIEPNAYGRSKLECENIILGGINGLASSARLFSFIGPRLPLDGQFAVGNFIQNAIHGEPIVVKSDGSSIRSYMYAGDLVIWILKILTHGSPSEIYNVGSSVPITISDLADKVSELVTPHPPVLRGTLPSNGQGSHLYVPNTMKAKDELGLFTYIGLDESIQRMAAYAVTEAYSTSCQTR